METAQRTVRFWQLHNRIEKSAGATASLTVIAPIGS